MAGSLYAIIKNKAKFRIVHDNRGQEDVNE
jgi:hypothetical protein